MGVAAQAFSRDLTLRQKWDKFGRLLVDLAVACLLVAACGVYSAYMARHSAAFSARQHYTVYDDVERARARWLLPLKQDPAALDNDTRAALQVRAHVRARTRMESVECGMAPLIRPSHEGFLL